LRISVCSGFLDGGIRLPRVAFEDFRGEQLLVPQEPHHIVIAGDDPHPILLIPMHGVRFTHVAKIGIGIGDDLWREQIIMDSRHHTHLLHAHTACMVAPACQEAIVRCTTEKSTDVRA
jgi:hypothetical protein